MTISRAIPVHLFLLVSLLLVSCNENNVPRPRGFFRIDLPEKEYQSFDTAFPYSFEYPVYATVEPNKSDWAEPWWADVKYPAFKARLHLSYKPVRNNLANYINDTHIMVGKLIPKATGIREDVVIDLDHRVFGVIFHIGGNGVASPHQFYITDSTKHFLRGALYFNVIPNNDSLTPVIDFLKEDILHMISTLRWD